MNTNLLKSIAGIALLGALAAAPAVSATPMAAPEKGGMPMARVDLGESSRLAGEASRFLQQPKLGEAIALAKSSKEATDEATRNPGEFLAKQGVMVPRNVQVKFDPSGDGGAAAKVKVEIIIRCCPGSLTIIISW